MGIPHLTPMQLDRAAGILVGGSAGDALGAGYEFGSPCPAESVQMRRGALTGRPAGSWTDDTDMALCVAQAAAQGLRLDRSDGQLAVAEWFLRWYADGPPDIGNQTRAVLSSAGTPAGLAAAAATYQRHHPEAAGNGSLMRTGPVAFAHLGDDDALAAAARAVSSLTHPHELAGDACVLWCIAIDRAVREGRVDGIWDGLALLPPDRGDRWRLLLEEAATLPASRLRNNGFVVTALQAAWRAVADNAHLTGPAQLDAGLRAAVAIGGDTDTVAAIAGALLGALHGASAVPFAWRRRLGGWPVAMGHRDLVAMGVLAARGGTSDNIGWPSAGDLLPYYERSWRPAGMQVELPSGSGVLWGDVAALGKVDAQSFVSLCRIGKDQRRGREHHEVWLMDDASNADATFVLSDTADMVERLYQEHGSVFVHCVRCESRTPAVAVAWLVRHRGHALDAAFDAVAGAMPRSRIHDSLRTALGGI